MTKNTLSLAFAAMILVLHPLAASAYIGPGLGGGAIAAVFGVIGSVVLAIFAVIYYPIKRMLKNRKKSPAADKPSTDA